MDFDISLDYTIEDLNAYWRGFMRKRPERRGAKEASPRALRLGGWFFIVGGVVSLFAWPMFRDHLDLSMRGLEGLLLFLMRTPLAGVLELALGISLLRQSRQPPEGPPYPRWVNQAWKKYQESGRLYNCRFTEDGVWVHDSKSDHRYDYEALEALWEDPDRFYLVLPGNRGLYVLNKARFTAGSPEDLPGFWAERTGKAVKPVK